MNSRIAEDMDGIETVKAAAQEQAEIERFRKNISTYRDASVKQGDIEARFIPMLLLALAMGFGLLHALYLARLGEITLANVITYYSALSMLGFPTNTSVMAYSRISLGLASARRLLAIMNTENNLDQNEDGYAQRIKGDVSFRNVSFSYDGKVNNLKDISLEAKAGQTIAVVGQTGSGKTSLIRLINRTNDPQEGHIFIDGVNLRDWRLDTLRSQISIIEQDIFSFQKASLKTSHLANPVPRRKKLKKPRAKPRQLISSRNCPMATILSSANVVRHFLAGNVSASPWHARSLPIHAF